MSFDILSHFSLPSRTDRLVFADAKHPLVEIDVKRDDLIHTDVQGNKWRKLSHNLRKASKNNQTNIITMGGPWSNHLAATASACLLLGFSCEAFVRGKINESDYSATIKHCLSCGMKLHFLEKHEYDILKEQEIPNIDSSRYFIPEGGANADGVKGCMEILQEEKTIYDYVATPVGSGTTCAGLLLAAKSHTRILAFSVFKNADRLAKMIEEKIRLYDSNESVISTAMKKLVVIDKYHFGGFANVTNELMEFRQSLYKDTGINTDLVYTAKMFYGIQDMIRTGFFKKQAKIMLLHTGGIQGNQGFQPDMN